MCGQAGAAGTSCRGPAGESHDATEVVPGGAFVRSYWVLERAIDAPDEVSGGTVDDFESGRVMASPAELVKIARTTGKPVYWFFVDHGDDPL